MKTCKLFKNIVWGMTLCGALCTTSCTSFDELNTDPTRMDEVNPGTLLNPILYETSVYNWKRYNSYTYDLMQCAVSTSSTNGVGWWYMTDSEGDGTWTTYYKWINNAKEMMRLTGKLPEASKQPNYDAISLTLQCWLYQILTDAFGDIPMSEACSADKGILAPKFDTQQQVYQQIIDNLKTANELFDKANGLIYNQSGEMLYKTSKGDATGILKWKKFCNSLRLRALLRVIDVPEFNAKQELRTMLTDPATYPVFESNDDAALLAISGTYPEEAPLTRPQDFTSYVQISEFFVNLLKGWNDPRLQVYATQVTLPDQTKDYVGLPSGYQTLPSTTASGLNQEMAKAPMKLAIMPYAEVEFIKAELLKKGVIDGGSNAAKEAYQKGVQAAIEQWGQKMPEHYFENPEAAYDDTLERIMNQKFVALFFCDYQQWFEYNRTGFPVLPVGPGIANANNKMPKRFKYPSALQRTNLKNYQAAKANMGGDDFHIRLMWQQ